MATEQADTARQQGNEFYKAGQINAGESEAILWFGKEAHTEVIAIKAYNTAVALAPSDPTPLSNLSAASFEAGDYAKCIEFGTKALDILEGEADDDTRKQKLFVRLAKAHLHLFQSDKAEPLLAKLTAAGPEPEALRDASKRMTLVRSEVTSKKVLQETLFQLPRYKPHLTAEADYFSVGHDVPDSQYGGTLRKTTKDAKVVSFLFCGIGDARNLFKTMAFYALEGPVSDQRAHFTILDHKPAVLARDLIFFALLDDLSQTGFSLHTMREFTGERRAQFDETLSVLVYLYATQIMPAYAWQRLQKTIQRLLDAFEKHEQPISWVYVPATVQDAIRPTLETWRPIPTGPYSTERFRELTVDQNMRQPDTSSFPELKSEHRLFDDFGIALPAQPILENHDPDLAQLLRDYKTRDASAEKQRISTHVNSKWRSNITLVDMAWENDKEATGERQTPDMSFTPFSVIDFLATAFQELGPVEGPTILSYADFFFTLTINAITELRGRMLVEVRLGEMAEVLERTRYGALDRGSALEDGAGATEWPDRYSVIHMSNIP